MWLTTPFNNTQTLKFKTQLSIAFFTAVNHKITTTTNSNQRTVKKSTNHNPRTWTFEWITKWLTAAKNETVDWAEFPRVCNVIEKRCYHQSLTTKETMMIRWPDEFYRNPNMLPNMVHPVSLGTLCSSQQQTYCAKWNILINLQMYQPCIACMKTDGSLERNNMLTVDANPSME